MRASPVTVIARRVHFHPGFRPLSSQFCERTAVTAPGRQHPLRSERESRHWSIDDLAARTHLSPKMILRAEQGHGLNPQTRRILCACLGRSADELGLVSRHRPRLSDTEHASEDTGCGDGDLLAACTAEASTFIAAAADGHADPVLIQQAHSDAERLAVDYLSMPPATILGEVSALRARVLRMLEGHGAPKQAKDLYLVSGLLSGIIAYACLDLGHAEQADTQARAGAVCADFAGHDGLHAWLLGTRSLVARFQGRHRYALDLAREGLRHAAGGTSEVRLRCGVAQSLANLGDAEGTWRALDLAHDARDAVDSPDVSKGIFAFSEAKLSYYSGSSLIWLPGRREARTAEHDSEQAIRLFRSGPREERSLSDEALAHIYLATARVRLGDLEGVREALRPVLAIPVRERISWQRKRLARVGDLLDAGRLRSSRTARRLREEVAAFSEPSVDRIRDTGAPHMSSERAHRAHGGTSDER
jgi:transcriptional regulator with XRE-family HTH domain